MNNWLEISDNTIDTTHIQQEIERRLIKIPADKQNPAETMAELRRQMLSTPDDATELPPLYEADVVPRGYTINWRNPILGPLNAILRRFINLELRRSIYPALEQQSTLNRQILQVLMRLQAENATLRRQIERLQQAKK